MNFSVKSVSHFDVANKEAEKTLLKSLKSKMLFWQAVIKKILLQKCTMIKVIMCGMTHYGHCSTAYLALSVLLIFLIA